LDSATIIPGRESIGLVRFLAGSTVGAFSVVTSLACAVPTQQSVSVDANDEIAIEVDYSGVLPDSEPLILSEPPEQGRNESAAVSRTRYSLDHASQRRDFSRVRFATTAAAARAGGVFATRATRYQADDPDCLAEVVSLFDAFEVVTTAGDWRPRIDRVRPIRFEATPTVTDVP